MGWARYSARVTNTPNMPEYPANSLVAIDSLQPDPRNARLHDERNLKAVMASLQRFGQQKPIVVHANGVVIAGNATMEAARRLGWTHVWAVHSDLDGAEATAYGVADNRTAELATWDGEMLQALAAEVDLTEFISPDDLTHILDGLAVEPEALDSTEDKHTSDALYSLVNDAIPEEEWPEHGSVWRCGDGSLLVVASPVSDKHLWAPHMDSVDLCLWWPSVFALHADKWQGKRCMLVQPVRQVAAYTLRAARVLGAVERVA